MLTWIVLVLGLYLVQLFIPSLFRIGQVGLTRYVGSRDELPPLPVVAGRTERAARNMAESMPFFLAAATLIIVFEREAGLPIIGAQIFFWARLAYLALYAAAVPWLRSLTWSVAFAAIVLMAWPLLQGGVA